MKPYGNERSWHIDAVNATKHRPNQASNTRRAIRRAYRHRRRAQDKRAIRNEVS